MRAPGRDVGARADDVLSGASRRQGYRTLLVSNIPVVRGPDGVLAAPALWARDIGANAEVVDGLILICPLRAAREDEDLAPLHPAIEVVDRAALDRRRIDALVGRSDVVELPGNADWAAAALARRMLRRARAAGVPAIVGLSSNRVRTTLLNARGGSLRRRLDARLRALSIRLSQRYLLRRADGVRVVGRGLLPLVEDLARDVHVDTASWITEADFAPRREMRQAGPWRIVIASRLEPMKGVALGIEAVAGLVSRGADLRLRVYGTGPEDARLRAEAKALGLAGRCDFAGQVAYPGPFHAALGEADFVLLTNLNDEQPRLIFDAISQGALPVCPDNPAYRPLGLDRRLFYRQGDAASLAAVLESLVALPGAEKAGLLDGLVALARTRTIDSMHRARRDWILSLLGRQAPAPRRR